MWFQSVSVTALSSCAARGTVVCAAAFHFDTGGALWFSKSLMAEPTAPSPAPDAAAPAASADAASNTISLRDVGMRYVQVLQRLFDIAAFSLSASRTVNEQGYDDFLRATAVMPAAPYHLGFDAAKEETERWWLKHGVNEALNTLAHFLEDCRKLCALCELRAAQAGNGAGVPEIEAKLQADELATPFAKKLAHLQSAYGITSPFSDTLLDLDRLRRCLFERGGVVGEQELIVRLKMVQIIPAKAASPDAARAGEAGGAQVSGKMLDAVRKFAPGERIVFSKTEHTAVFLTLSMFLGSMLDGVQAVATRLGMDQTAPAPAS